jgi:DNA replication and repair protein RecF
MTRMPEEASAPPLYRLNIACFRCHTNFFLQAQSRLLMLTGPNGTGKTAALEALSLLAPGRGLRQAAPSDLGQHGATAPWSVRLWIPDSDDDSLLCSTIEAGRRRASAQNNPLPSLMALTDWVRLSWPAFGLCAGSTDRRMALDRLTLTLDPSYGPLAAAYDKALRQRNLLLSQGERDSLWYDSLEKQMAQLGVCIVFKRAHSIARLTQEMTRHITPLGKAQLSISGAAEDLCMQGLQLQAGGQETSLAEASTTGGSLTGASLTGGSMPDVSAGGLPTNDPICHPTNDPICHPTNLAPWQALYQKALHASRNHDFVRKITSFGPHKSKVTLHHASGREGQICSAGEQKALVLSVALAALRLARNDSPHHPHFFLLDEALSLLDDQKQAWLWQELRALGIFCVLTGLPGAHTPPDVQVVDLTSLATSTHDVQI